MAKWYKNMGEPMRVETGKIINSGPKVPGKDSELLSACNEKAFVSFTLVTLVAMKRTVWKGNGIIGEMT